MKRISIITPSFNQGAFLERTIQSVLSQGYKDLEYIIIDGGSTDNSVEVIKKYEKHLAYWISEKDAGMYDAINKGFARSTGEIMGWLNSDDMLLPGALSTISEAFELSSNVKWVTGMPVSIDEADRIISFQPLTSWSKLRILSGDYRWIQQESTYWHRSLWETAGSKVDTQFTLAGDFELWARFFRHEKLYSIGIAMAGFRKRSGNQKSLEGLKSYIAQVDTVIKRESELISSSQRRRIQLIKLMRPLSQLMVTNTLRRKAERAVEKLQERAPRITYNRSTNKMEIKG